MLVSGSNGLPGTATMTTISKQAVTSELKRDGSLAMTAIKRFSADQCTTLAASIAFYAAFSLAPTLLMVIAVAGWFFGAEAARGQLFGRVHDFLGNEAAAAIQAIVENAHRQGGSGIAAMMSIALLIVGASATFSSLNTALDVVFPALPREKRSGIALMVRVRLVSFGLVLGVAFLLVVSLVLDTVVTYLGNMVWGNSPFVVITNVLQMIISLAILSLAFTALMKLLPDAPIRWRDAWVGGVVSAVLFTIGKKLFALYLAHAGTASAFGAAGSLAVLLMWLYFSSAVLLLGAEFAAVKGGFGERKDKSAAAAAAALDKHGQSIAPNAATAKSSNSGSLPQWVPDAVRQSPALRMVGLSGAGPDSGDNAAASAGFAIDAEPLATVPNAQVMAATAVPSSEGAVNDAAAFGAARRLFSKRKSATERQSRSTGSAIDAVIARSKHPFAFRLALQAAPLAFQGISLLIPVRRMVDVPVGRAPNPTQDRGAFGLVGRLLGATMPSQRQGGSDKSASASASPGKQSLLKGKSVRAVPAPKTKHPLTAALFAAGTGLLLASLANRDRHR